MNVRTFFTLYTISLPIFFTLDMVWLGVIAKNFYATHLGHLLGEVQWLPAILFYLLFLMGLTFFATYPAVVQHSIFKAVSLGGLFGFFTYMTYDLTNYATLTSWPLGVVFVDMFWGTVLGAGVSALTYYLYISFCNFYEAS